MKRRTPAWLFGLGALALAGCATPYQAMGFSGGYSEVQLDRNTFRVEFQGNGYTQRQTIETYLLYRCAELTVEAGFDYFIILGSGTEARQETYTTPGRFSGTAYGDIVTGTYRPGQTYHFTKYGAATIIKVFKGEKPADNPAAFDANELMRYLSSRIRKE